MGHTRHTTKPIEKFINEISFLLLQGLLHLTDGKISIETGYYSCGVFLLHDSPESNEKQWLLTGTFYIPICNSYICTNLIKT